MKLLDLPGIDSHFRDYQKKVYETVAHDDALTIDSAPYQRKQLELALKEVKRFRRALDIGAHVGFFSVPMSSCFDSVTAFEPIKENFRCLEANVPPNVQCINAGVGAKSENRFAINTKPSNSGGWRLMNDLDVSAELERSRAGVADSECSYVDFGIDIVAIDSLGLDDVDFIKMDIQGMELDALKGGAETIKRCRPVILVEVTSSTTPKEETRALRSYLEQMGMFCRCRVNKDEVWA